MKLRVIVDVDVSPTLAETIQRGGFTLCADGSGQQVKVGGTSPAVPKRKTKVLFVENPETPITHFAETKVSESK
jgi:hypothetical protein